MSDSTTPPVGATLPDRTVLVNDWGRIAVSLVVVVAFVVVLALVMTRAVTDSPILDQMLQLLGTLTTGVVTYWIGSSAGSTEKNRTQKGNTP